MIRPRISTCYSTTTVISHQMDDMKFELNICNLNWRDMKFELNICNQCWPDRTRCTLGIYALGNEGNKMKFVYSRFDDDMTCHVDRMILRKQYHNMKLELNMYVCNQSCTYWVTYKEKSSWWNTQQGDDRKQRICWEYYDMTFERARTWGHDCYDICYAVKNIE